MNSLPHLLKPRAVFLEILYGCNLYCKYCYIGADKNHTQPVIPSLDTTFEILDILKENGVEELQLLGGEPLIHPHINEICKRIADLNFSSKGIVTNGTVLNFDKLNLLHETGFWVDVSFRGSTAISFDYITGVNGSFNKAINTLSSLSNKDIEVGIEIDCVPQNYTHVFEMVDNLTHLGIKLKSVLLHRALPRGDAIKNGGYFLSLDQWRVLFKEAARVRDELNVPIRFEDGFPYCLVNQQDWDLLSPCACGYSIITIDPTGEARYCPCHDETLGNVLQIPFSKIWEDGLRGYRSLTRHDPACLDCDLLDICRGGCSASGQQKMNEGIDIFNHFFHPIKLDHNSAQSSTNNYLSS